MNAMAKHLANSLEIRNGARVVQVKHENNAWQIATETGELIEARAVIMTPPVPQTLEILARANFK